MKSEVSELSSIAVRQAKRRRTMASQSSPSKLSNLLEMFGVHRSPSSMSSWKRTGTSTNTQNKFSYAESVDSQASPMSHSDFGELVTLPEDSINGENLNEGIFHEGNQVESEDELSGDVIEVRPRPLRRKLPPRSTRAKLGHSSRKRTTIQKSKSCEKPVKLASDLNLATTSRNFKPQSETERAKVRSGIEEYTKPKRNAFLLSNKDDFLALLPESNFIGRLQRARDIGNEKPVTIPYVALKSQPKSVLAKMKPYQLEGLSFLLWMHFNGMSSILGDEMGLGKTLQTLSLFQYLKDYEPIKGENRPYLVVCPLSVLSSWMNEAKKWVPHLETVRFHGPKAEREKLKDDCRPGKPKSKSIDIVVTTYETFVSEESWFKRAFVWRYCVLDEGHKIKNDKSNISKALQGMRAEYRLLLTGTPLQNNLLEMWALLHWLYPEVFTIDTADKFKHSFDLTKGSVSTSFMDDARNLLELIMLRRMKSSPNVNLGLPPKDEVLLYVPLTPMQRLWYTRLLTKADSMLLEELFKSAGDKEAKLAKQMGGDRKELVQLEAAADAAEQLKQGTSDVWAETKAIMEKVIQNEQTEKGDSEWKKLMNLVMQLRKVCSHPYILPNAQPDPYYLGDHVKLASGKFIVLDKLVEELVVNRGKKILIFSQFTSTLDLCEDLLVLKGANVMDNAPFRYLRFDGSTARARRNLSIRMFNDMSSEYKIMLISTRAGGLGINLTSASDVVFMDEDWNPQITRQAEARSHRIGQTQKVTVYKLCTQGTVEEQMMGRIRKKLYLSTKITESMRNIHSTAEHGKKRKRGSNAPHSTDEAIHLDKDSLKSLVRRGAQTLTRPEVDVTEMLSWDWETTLENCKDKPIDMHVVNNNTEDDLEQSWLNTMEKVETAIFEGKRHQKAIEKAAKENGDLDHSDRRVGKNTTVMVDGYAISKESMNCGDWEAVPTFAGKDPRLAEPVRAKRAKIQHQDFCLHCWDGGELKCCSGCPRAYHMRCLQKEFNSKALFGNFYCPQHECRDCQSKATEAGGMIFRCRWCENGFCEDCLDWDVARLIGDNLPEHEMVGFRPVDQAWYIECPGCIKHWETHEKDVEWVKAERARIQEEYDEFVGKEKAEPTLDYSESQISTSATASEVATPTEIETLPPPAKKLRSRLRQG